MILEVEVVGVVADGSGSGMGFAAGLWVVEEMR